MTRSILVNRSAKKSKIFLASQVRRVLAINCCRVAISPVDRIRTHRSTWVLRDIVVRLWTALHRSSNPRLVRVPCTSRMFCNILHELVRPAATSGVGQPACEGHLDVSVRLDAALARHLIARHVDGSAWRWKR